MIDLQELKDALRELLLPPDASSRMALYFKFLQLNTEGDFKVGLTHLNHALCSSSTDV
jgi:hypothetical protein